MTVGASETIGGKVPPRFDRLRTIVRLGWLAVRYVSDCVKPSPRSDVVRGARQPRDARTVDVLRAQALRRGHARLLLGVPALAAVRRARPAGPRGAAHRGARGGRPPA